MLGERDMATRYREETVFKSHFMSGRMRKPSSGSVVAEER